MNAYRRIVPRLTFGGPSRLSPVIRSAIETVKKTQLSQEIQQYHVFLIITVRHTCIQLSSRRRQQCLVKFTEMAPIRSEVELVVHYGIFIVQGKFIDMSN